jgi:hypothetical protein
MAALLALTLQIVLSFGHGHGFDAGPAPSVAGTSGGASVPSPSGGTGQHDEDYCATCAILALLTGAQTASGPVFVLLVALASAEITVAPEAPRLGASRTAFRSRAPPLS